jgi:hypothetical protein
MELALDVQVLWPLPLVDAVQLTRTDGGIASVAATAPCAAARWCMFLETHCNQWLAP